MVNVIHDKDQHGPGKTAPSQNSRSLGDRLFAVKDDFGTLYRQEIALVKAEVREGLDKTKKSAGTLVLGAALMIGGFGLLLGMVTQLIGWAALEAGLGLMPSLIIGFGLTSCLALGLGAYALKRGQEKLANQSYQVPRTVDSMKKNKEILEDKVA